MVEQFIEIDSTYRNRRQYPNPADFTILFSTSGTSNNPFQARDPITDQGIIYPPPDSGNPTDTFLYQLLNGQDNGLVHIDRTFLGPTDPFINPEQYDNAYLSQILEQSFTAGEEPILDYFAETGEFGWDFIQIDDTAITPISTFKLVIDDVEFGNFKNSDYDGYYLGQTLFVVDFGTGPAPSFPPRITTHRIIRYDGYPIFEMTVDTPITPIPTIFTFIIPFGGSSVTITNPLLLTQIDRKYVLRVSPDTFYDTLQTFQTQVPPARRDQKLLTRIRRNVPQLDSTSWTGSRFNLTLGLDASNVDGTYVGDFIWVLRSNEYHQIKTYDASTRLLTLNTPLSQTIRSLFTQQDIATDAITTLAVFRQGVGRLGVSYDTSTDSEFIVSVGTEGYDWFTGPAIPSTAPYAPGGMDAHTTDDGSAGPVYAMVHWDLVGGEYQPTYVRQSDQAGSGTWSSVNINTGGAYVVPPPTHRISIMLINQTTGGIRKQGVALTDPSLNIYFARLSDLLGTVEHYTNTGLDGYVWGVQEVEVSGTFQPGIFYVDSATLFPTFVTSTNQSGSAWGTPTVITTTPVSGGIGSIFCENPPVPATGQSCLLVGGINLGIGYMDTSDNFYFVSSLVPDGSSWSSPVLVATGGIGVVGDPRVVVGRDGTIFYFFVNDSGLNMVYSTDLLGLTWSTPIILDSDAQTPFDIALNDYEMPLVVYNVSDTIVRYLSLDVSINILRFSNDNWNPLTFRGPRHTQCYNVELVNLEMPNALLEVGRGGLLSKYPYLYVELSNSSSTRTNIPNSFTSNNPNATRSLFKVPIDDDSNPDRARFLYLSSGGMVQTIFFKPDDPLKFTIRLPNGEIFKTKNDYLSPLPPNPNIQISALFSIKPVT